MMIRSLTLLILLIVSWHAFAGSSLIPDRRRPQFQTEFGYAVFPYPYNLPGIGEGISAVAGANNVGGTYIDVYGLAFGGDVKGFALGVADIHLISKHLLLDLGGGSISKAAITSYSKRGMESDKNDYTIIEVSDTKSTGARLISTFFDRRFEIYTAFYTFEGRFDRIRDSDGDIIVESDDPAKEKGDTTILGLRVDLTDDYADPRRGISFDISGWHNPKEDIGAEYDVIDMSLTGYIPLGKRSTWAFNLFRSDSHVSQQGETDKNAVADYLGLNCSSVADPERRKFCEQLLDNMVAQNTYGSASSLGGFNRLRSYPVSRFSGAHSEFFGSEIRWNLTDEFTPFDIYIVKDIRTAIQLSLFYELGSVADDRNELWDVMRASYGFGLRIVTASGVVFRGELAYGHEGMYPSVFIGYPWEL